MRPGSRSKRLREPAPSWAAPEPGFRPVRGVPRRQPPGPGSEWRFPLPARESFAKLNQISGRSQARDPSVNYLVTKAMRVFLVLLTLGCLLLSALPAQAHSALPPGHQQIKYSRRAYPSQINYGPIEDGNGEIGQGPSAGAFMTLPFMGRHYLT